MKQFIVKYIYVNLFEISKQKILNWKKIFNNNIPNHTDLVKKKTFYMKPFLFLKSLIILFYCYIKIKINLFLIVDS